MTVRMIALKPFPYAGKRIAKGAEFDARGRLNAPGSDATVLKAIGHAKEAPARVEAPRVVTQAPQTYRTRIMTAEPPAPVITPEPEIVTKTDALDDMEADALHELAKERGVYVHHRAGADRVRQALREAQESSAE